MTGNPLGPQLDDRSFDDLLQAARRRAARFVPEWQQSWTDFNASDPGATLLDLFAWFTEQMLFRLNQVPELHRRKLIELMGLSQAEPRVARAFVEFEPARGPVTVPAGTRVAGPAADGTGTVVFETEDHVELVPHPLASVRVFDGQRYRERTLDNDEPRGTFEPLGPGAPGCALFLGFEPAAGSGDQQFPSRVRLVVTAVDRQGGASGDGVDVTWSYARPGAKGEVPQWFDLAVEVDDTDGFARTGAIVLAGVAGSGSQAVAPVRWAEEAKPMFWLRCLVSDRARRPLRPATVRSIRSNSVGAAQHLTVVDEDLGPGQGVPGQVARLANAGVLPSTLELVTIVGDARQRWQRAERGAVAETDAGARDEHGALRVYELDADDGTIRFGERRSALPRPGERIHASYRAGGGARGNVAAGALSQLLRPIRGVRKVTNREAAFGGRDRETIAQLVERAPHELRRRSRAVTAGDFESLVREQVDGIAVVRTLPNVHTGFPGVDARGCVTVVLVPAIDAGAAPDQQPLPTQRQLELARRVLDDNRLIGTEVRVIGPSYAVVVVRGRLQVGHGHSPSAVQERARAVLRQELQPFPVGTSGTLGESPFGRELRRGLLHARLLEIDGVLRVDRFEMEVEVAGRRVPVGAAFALEPHMLTWPGGLEALVAEAARAGGPS